MNKFILLLMMLLTLTGCQTSQQQAYGPAYGPGEEGGLGGTGLIANTDSGLGGTGMVADVGSGLGGTGIIGEITGFGSIFVNGAEVELDDNTRFFIDGNAVDSYQPVIGDVVIMRAVDGKPFMHATELHVQHQVIGKVETVDTTKRQLQVLGQTVIIDKSAKVPNAGERIRVSGFRDNQNIIHSTLWRPAEDATDLLYGPIARNGNGWRIANQPVSLPAGMKAESGDMVQLHGTMSDGIFKAKSASVLRQLPFSQPVQRLLLQGYDGSAELRAYGLSNLSPRGKVSGNDFRLELQRDQSGWRLMRQLDYRSLPKGNPTPVDPARPARFTPDRPRPDIPVLPNNIPLPGRFFR